MIISCLILYKYSFLLKLPRTLYQSISEFLVQSSGSQNSVMRGTLGTKYVSRTSAPHVDDIMSNKKCEKNLVHKRVTWYVGKPTAIQPTNDN